MSHWVLNKASALAGAVGFMLGFPLIALADADLAGQAKHRVTINSSVKWCLRAPKSEQVVYRGMANFDGAGASSASLLYPAPDAGSFLAAVITHAFIVDSQKKSQKDKLQASADKVLSSYRVVLDNFNYRDLMRQSLEKTANGPNASLIEDSDESCQEILVESTPVFSLTQDQMAIVLDNVIVIHTPGGAPEDAYRSTTRVISVARKLSDPSVYWTANSGEKIKDESAQLVANSLDIAFHDAAAGADSDGISYRTIRYREGAAEKIERAQVLSDQCGRLLIRNLRGTLMSVPASRPSTAAMTADHCGSGGTQVN